MTLHRWIPVVAILTLGLPGLLTGQANPAACNGDSTRVTGAVKRLGGAPVGNAAVTVAWNTLVVDGLYVSNVRCSRRATSAADGTFQVDSVPDDDAALVTADVGDGSAGVAVRHALRDLVAPLVVFVAPPMEPSVAGGACEMQGMIVTVAGAPVVNANVTVNGGDGVRTDASGAFRSTRCDAEGAAFVVRALSLARAEIWVATATPVHRWVLALDRAVPRMDAVVVSAPSDRPRDVTGFEARRRQGFGRFVTRADIVARQPMQLQMMFYSLPGMLVNGSQVSFARARGLNCSPRVVLDGTPITAGSVFLTTINPNDVYGIELYRGASETPVEFQGMGSACGSIVVWTRVALDANLN